MVYSKRNYNDIVHWNMSLRMKNISLAVIIITTVRPFMNITSQEYEIMATTNAAYQK